MVADRAEGLTTAQLDALLAAEVAAVDAAAAERRAAAATAARRVAVEPRPDGQAVLVAEAPAVDILAIMRGLTRAAGDRAPGDERGVDARRFDALRDWGRDALAEDKTGAASGAGCSMSARAAWRPHVLITVALSTVLGLDDDPGHLHGYGPVPAHVARQAAAEGTLKRLLTDPQDTPTRRSRWATADLDRAAGGLGALRAAVEAGQQKVAEPGRTQSWAGGEPPF